MARQFVQLHNHSAYSLLDGKSPVNDLAATAARFKNPAVAITDHGGMPGAVRFINACKKHGVTPIIGQEFYFARDVNAHIGNSDDQKGIFHQIILARNKVGYHNLIRLSSRAYREGFYKSPRIDLDMLADHSAGLIGTTSCLSGIVNDHLLKGEFEEACRWASDFADVFDPGCYYVEIQNHGIADQLAILDMQIKLAKRLGLPLVATNDSHYIEHGDCDSHDDLLCVGTGALKDQEKRFQFTSDENYFRSPDEMWELFPEQDFPGACNNTLAIAEMCDFHDPTENDLLIPHFDYQSEGFSSSGEMLRTITFDGARERFGNSRGEISQKVRERHEHELAVIDKMGFNDYFLIVIDIMRAARERGIRYAPGRGSAAGSAVAYSTGITGVDPFEHSLFFERFLNEGRGGMPDIDIDFDKFRRQEMVDYTVEKYGEDHVAKVAIYAVAGVKSSIKSAARIIRLSHRVSDIYAVMNTDKHPLSIQMADECDPSWDDEQVTAWKEAKALRDLAKGSEVGAIMHSAVGIEGAITAKGTGAAALLITPTPVTENFPVHNSKSHSLPVSQYDKVDIEECGALKMDFLGLKNISLVDNAVRRVEEDFGKVIDLDTLPLDDPATFRLIRDCEVDGIFQIESEGMRGVIKAMMPTTFQDISALIALHRPGPMASNAHMSYADRKNGREEVVFEIPESEEILGETYALPVYQEQIMSLGQKYAGYSLREADDFRRAMGKKKPEVMKAMHGEFLERVEANGYTKQIGARLWDIILPFAGYAFNRCVSGDTEIWLGASGSDSDGTMTVEELYARLHENILEGNPGRGGGNDYVGDCLHCQREDRPAVWRGRCSACHAWIKKFRAKDKGLSALSMHTDGRIRPRRIKDVHYNGIRPCFTITLADGKTISATDNHRHMTPDGWHRVDELVAGDELLVVGDDAVPSSSAYDYRLSRGERRHLGARVSTKNRTGKMSLGYIDGNHIKLQEWTERQEWKCASPGCSASKEAGDRIERAHLDGDRTNNDPSNLRMLCASHHKAHDYEHNHRVRRWQRGKPAVTVKIVSIEQVGERHVYDLEMDAGPDDDGTSDGVERSWIANGVLTHNSHSASYGLVSYQTAFLKARYPHQFVAAFIDSMSPDRYTPIIDWTKRVGVELRPVDINESYETSLSGKDFVRLGFNTVHEVGFGPRQTIVAERTRNGDYDSIYDFVARTIDNIDSELSPVRRPALISLIKAGAFDGLHESRIKLLDNLDDIMADARPKAKRRKREQAVFGDMIGDDPFGQTAVVREDEFSGEMSHVEKMRMEFDSCGFSLRPHPFTLIRDSVTHLRQHGEREFMLADHDDLTPGRNSRVVGNIFEIKNDVSKKGKKYSRFVLSTGYRAENIVTCVIFGEHLSPELVGELAQVHGSLRAEERSVIVNADGDYEDDANGDDEQMTEVRHTWEMRADKIVLQRAWNDLAEDGENVVAFDSRAVENRRQQSNRPDTRHKTAMRSRIARRTGEQDAVALVRRKRKVSK